MKVNKGWKVHALIEMRTMIATRAISFVVVANVSQVILADVYNSKNVFRRRSFPKNER
jgi:hypothetical protein